MKRGRKARGTAQQAGQIQQAQQVKQEPKTSNTGVYMFAGDVMEALQISQNSAYIIIRKLNNELKEAGYITVAGRVPTKYFHERMYC